MNRILVQNIETFETITRLTVGVEVGETVSDRVDQYLSGNERWGIVSLDDDADGEYMAVLLVAPLTGPDFEMDMATGEMEPVEQIDPQAELDAKMDIMMEMDMNDVPQEQILAMLTMENTAGENISAAGQAVIDEWIAEETGIIPEPKKPRKKRNTKSKAKGAKMSTQSPKKIRNFEILVAFIEARPGIGRDQVFQDPGLLTSLRTKAQIQAIANGDKTEVKRWNRRLNFLIRESKRQGVDIQIERKGRVAHYTIAPASGQLELPFDEAAEARNAAITGEDVSNEVIEAPVPPKEDAMRLIEEPNQSLDFESLLATLDDDNALITSDDQTAFEAAKEMLK